MAEILTEQAESLRAHPPQSNPASTPTTADTTTPGDTKGSEKHGRETKPKLPKGVVLDKDGKPYVEKTLTALRFKRV